MIELEYDDVIDVATGKHRMDKKWKNREMYWSELVQKLSKTHYTAESYNEYINTDARRQAEIKDIGGFVGGLLSGGRRKAHAIVHRQIVALDADFAKPNTWKNFKRTFGNACAVYTTHKHSPEKPRFRIILPLDRPVDPGEYEAIARRLATYAGIEAMDPTTYQPHRLMYWPSTSDDGDFYFDYVDDEWACADDILDTYHDWSDSSEWPVSSREKDVVKHALKKQENPLDKPGAVGLFCRTYTIQEAIDEFLSDFYEPTDLEDRFTYLQGSTAAGLVVYDDMFAYSHHGTDPAGGKLCNAFDLVRLHLYGEDDGRIDTDTVAPGKLPSFRSMADMVGRDKKCRRTLVDEKLDSAKTAFEGYAGPEYESRTVADLQPDIQNENDDDDWKELLDCDKAGVKSTIDNVVVILENDPLLKGKFAFDQFERREVLLSLPFWRKAEETSKYLKDSDDASLRHYLERAYGIIGKDRIKDAFDIVMQRHGFHPVRQYLKSNKWDGESRLETLFIDYMGAEDDDAGYTRAVTRKSLIAAVARVFEPGCKFDNVITLVGRQGAGKSTIIRKLGKQWFSDTLPTIQGKEAYESIQGVWIMEMGELAGLRKAEVETIKNFISSPVDRYRVAYGRRTENFPRQLIFMATTNTTFFINDASGGRRFWPVTVNPENAIYDTFKDLTESEINQIWAEALHYYRLGEDLHLSAELERAAKNIQKAHSEQDDRIGLIEEYLNKRLPQDWVSRSIHERKNWLSSDGDEQELQTVGTKERQKVCIQEIWSECLQRSPGDLTNVQARSLHAIMQHLPGWQKYDGKMKFRIYGVQRGYIRKI
jgi:putative DNA primase/helicase